jgi:fumarate hydratase subunit alpha
MRLVTAREITEAVSNLFKQANYELGDDVIAALKKARKDEESPAGREALDAILENSRIAADDKIPLCQDCGTAIIFLEIGQDVHIDNGGLSDAVNEGVRRAYQEGYLRKSIRVIIHPRSSTRISSPAIK